MAIFSEKKNFLPSLGCKGYLPKFNDQECNSLHLWGFTLLTFPSHFVIIGDEKSVTDTQIVYCFVWNKTLKRINRIASGKVTKLRWVESDFYRSTKHTLLHDVLGWFWSWCWLTWYWNERWSLILYSRWCLWFWSIRLSRCQVGCWTTRDLFVRLAGTVMCFPCLETQRLPSTVGWLL